MMYLLSLLQKKQTTNSDWDRFSVLIEVKASSYIVSVIDCETGPYLSN